MTSPPPPPQDENFLTGPPTNGRVGVVVSATPNSMFVNIGGTTVPVSFLGPFTGSAIVPPAAGTVVHVIQQDAIWIATGRLIGAGTNAVLNPGFEDSAPGTMPVNWFSADAAGVSVAQVVDVDDSPEGDYATLVTSNQASTHVLYSSPIPVNVGEQWSLSANVGGEYGGNPLETADAAVIALWFANATDLYPTTSAADIIAGTSTDVPQHPPYRSVFGTVTVPAAAVFMRVALRSILAAGQGLVWDNVIARKV